MHASVTHAIGKLGIPDRVLLKPGALDEEEWATMKTHSTVGAELLAGSATPSCRWPRASRAPTTSGWDGGGYPDGIKGRDILLVGRICAIVDVYDALLSKRVYKEAWGMDETLAEIRRESGSHFDPELVSAVLRLAPRLGNELRASYARENYCSSTAQPVVA